MKKLIALTIALAPLSAFAQQLRDINTIAAKFTNLGTLFITIIVSLSILVMVYGIFTYIISSNDPEKRKEGGKNILFGVIGLFLIFSIWGLVNILRTSFTTNNTKDTANDINRITVNQIPDVPNN